MAKEVLNILLLRGLVREQRHWARFPEALKLALPHAKLHFLDLPGIGTEHRRRSPKRISEITEDLRERWLPLRDSSKHDVNNWGIFSISLGSMVAMDWVTQHPGDFLWASLMNTSASDVGSPLARLKFSAITKVLGIAITQKPVQRESKILELTTSMLTERESLARDWAQFSFMGPRAREVALAQLWAAMNFRLPRSLPVPSCIFIGAEDRMVSPRCSREIARRLKLVSFEHPRAGHDICLDDPDWVASKLAEWIS